MPKTISYQPSSGGTVLSEVRWSPPGGYPLGLEVLSITQLRQRASDAHFKKPQRVHFQQLLLVSSGRCVHTIDFVPHECGPGSCLRLRAGQVQAYDFSAGWTGWLVVFAPEFVSSKTDVRSLDTLSAAQVFERLPTLMQLQPDMHAELERTVDQLRKDAALNAPVAVRNALLRHQLCAWLLRLSVQSALAQTGRPESGCQARFLRFKALVEQHYKEWHQLARYADRMGCTSKTLARATREIAGVSAKEFIVQRITLEARRLLVHTTSPVQAIGSELGFDEASNFTKFFRREAGMTPLQFRRLHAG